MRAWLLSTLLALGAPVTSRSIELDLSGLEQHMDDEALHRFYGDLILRLLEAGHAVGPGGELHLSLRSAGDEVVVECRGEQIHHQAEVDDADAAILGLELVHRAVDLAGICAAELEAPPGPRGFETDAALVLDADTLSTAELSALAHALVEDEVRLVGDEQMASARLCALGARVEEGVFIVDVGLSCEAGESEVEIDVRTGAAVERWRGRAAHAQPEPEPEPEPADPSEPEASEPEPSPPKDPGRARPRPDGWGLSLGLALGAELRIPELGPDLRIELAALHPSGLFVGALAQLAPSRAGELAVFDSAALASLGWRGVVSDRVVLRPGIGLGLAIHRFAFPNEPVGHRLDLGLRVPLELDLRLTRRLHLGFALAVSVATRKIVHRADGVELWTRGYLRLEALLGLRFDWFPSTPAS